jgi:hypothetical protein
MSMATKPDIIVTNQNADTVGVLLNAGDGTFLSQITYSVPSGSGVSSPAVVDVDGDGKLDIIVTNNGGNSVGVFLNSGDGTFFAQTAYPTGSGSSPQSLSVVDVNSDNKPDIIVANNAGNNVGVLLNIGDGTFLPQTTYSTGSNSHPQSVSVVDMNCDNKPDIIVANSGNNNVGILLNSGDGTFLPQTTYPAGSNPRSVSVIDVNNDNKPDIVVANSDANSVSVLLAS